MNFDEKAKGWDMDPDRVARARAFAYEILKANYIYTSHASPYK